MRQVPPMSSTDEIASAFADAIPELLADHHAQHQRTNEYLMATQYSCSQDDYCSTSRTDAIEMRNLGTLNELDDGTQADLLPLNALLSWVWPAAPG